MKKNELFDALGNISESYVESAASAREKTSAKRVKLLRPAAIAVAAVITVIGGVSAAAVGAGLINVKRGDAIIGQKYQGDATDELDIKLLGFENGEPKFDITVKDPTKAPFIEIANGMATVRPLSYEVSGVGELLMKWAEDISLKTDEESAAAPLFDMHPGVEIGRLVSKTKKSDNELKADAELYYGRDFDNFVYQGEIISNSQLCVSASDGSLQKITISRRCYYTDSTDGEEVSLTVESEVYEAKDTQPWKKAVNATGTELDPTVMPEISEEEFSETPITPEDEYCPLDELKPLSIAVKGVVIETKGDQPLELYGNWVLTN